MAPNIPIAVRPTMSIPNREAAPVLVMVPLEVAEGPLEVPEGAEDECAAADPDAEGAVYVPFMLVVAVTKPDEAPAVPLG